MPSSNPQPGGLPGSVPVTADGGSDDVGLFGWTPAVWTVGSPWSSPPTGGEAKAQVSLGVEGTGVAATSSAASTGDTDGDDGDGELTPDVEVGELVRQALAKAGSACLTHLDALDPEGVRQTRAGLRRIRTQLRSFRRILDPAWVVSTRAEVSWYASLLGPVRDVDVLAERVGRVHREDIGRDLLRDVLAVLELSRELSMAPVATVMAGERRRQLEGRLAAVGEAPLRGRSDEPASSALPPILARQWRDLQEASRAGRHDGSEANLAAVRLRARRLRHTAEVAAPVLGARLDRLADACRVLGDGLGEIHDAGASRAWLEDVARIRPQVGYVAGRLSVAEEKAAAEAAGRWVADYKEVRRRWRRWGPS